MLMSSAVVAEGTVLKVWTDETETRALLEYAKERKNTFVLVFLQDFGLLSRPLE